MPKNKYFLIISMIMFFIGFLFPVRNISAQTETAAPAAEIAEPGEQISSESDTKTPDISIKSPDTANLTIKSKYTNKSAIYFVILDGKVTPVRDEDGKIIDFSSSLGPGPIDIKWKSPFNEEKTCDSEEFLEFHTEQDIINSIGATLAEIKEYEERSGNKLIFEDNLTKQKFLYFPVYTKAYCRSIRLYNEQEAVISNIPLKTDYHIISPSRYNEIFTARGNETLQENETGDVSGTLTGDENVTYEIKDTTYYPLTIKKLHSDNTKEKEFVFQLDLFSNLIVSVDNNICPPPYGQEGISYCGIEPFWKFSKITYVKYDASGNHMTGDMNIPEQSYQNFSKAFKSLEEFDEWLDTLDNMSDTYKRYAHSRVEFAFLYNNIVHVEINKISINEEFRLKAGQYIVFNIPKGVKYTVSEIMPHSGKMMDVTIEGDGTIDPDGLGMSGTMDKETSVTFTNKEDFYSLVLEKSCPQERDKEFYDKSRFRFEISLDGKVTPVRDNDGKIIDFTSTFGSEPPDIIYSTSTGTEDRCSIYNVMYFFTEQEIIDKIKATIDELHDYGERTGNSIITQDAYGQYKIVFPVKTEANCWDIYLRDQDNITVKNIPAKTEYVIREIDRNWEVYTAKNNETLQENVTGVVTGTLTGIENVTFENKRTFYPLTIKKSSSEKSKEFNFKLNLLSQLYMEYRPVPCPPGPNSIIFCGLDTNWRDVEIKWEKYNASGLQGSGVIEQEYYEDFSEDFTSFQDAKTWLDNMNISEKYKQEALRFIEGNFRQYATVQIKIKGLSINKPFKLKADEYIVFNLPKDVKYTVSEITDPADGDMIIEIDGDDTGLIDEAKSVIFTNIPTTDISGTKEWRNVPAGVNLPSSITVWLHRDSEPVTSTTADAGSGWKWEFKDLPKFRPDGGLYEYTVTENALNNYDTEIDGFHIINTYDEEKTSLSVSKSWDDSFNQDGIRPDSVIIKLLADGSDTGKSAELNEGNKWTYEFTGLPMFTPDGSQKITYTVREDPVDGYRVSEISGDPITGYTITNQHIPETTEITVVKKWVGIPAGTSGPESVTIYLNADGELIRTHELTGSGWTNDWTYTFSDLPKYAHGEEIRYTVEEKPMDDYDSVTEGFTITNTYDPDQTSLPVEKVWDDDHNRDGIRPLSVTVQLLADGVDVKGKTIVLDAASNWQGQFTELVTGPVYSVREIETDLIRNDGSAPYKSVISEDEEGVFMIHNRHTPETIEISGVKVWDDQNDKLGERPDSILVHLFNGNTEVNYLTVTEADGWRWTFSGLPKYAHGKEIKYTVKEEVIGAYTTVITGDTVNGFTITNRLEVPPEEQPEEPPVFPPLRLIRELPRTGLTGNTFRSEKPASVRYAHIGMQLQIPVLGLISDIVSVEPADGEYPVEWLGMNAGLLAGSDLPGEGISVIAAHNTLGADEYGPFALLPTLSCGDRFFISSAKEGLKVFEVYANEKIDSAGINDLLTTASRFESTVTLMTCEDELPEGGYAARRIVAARQVN